MWAKHGEARVSRDVAPENGTAAAPTQPEPPAGPAAVPNGWEPTGLARTLLRIPLFYKILIANAVIVLLGAVFGTVAIMAFLRAEPGHSPFELVFGLAVAGVGITVLVNAMILRLALRPIYQLEETAARVQEGDVAARASLSPLADRELERLTRTFNSMLDATAAYRQRVRDVAAHALNAEEEERKRVARELHDETAQTLAALLIRLRVGRGIADPEARDAFLEDMRREISSALEGVRRFARGLRPPALDELGLVPALEAHVRGISESIDLPIRIEADPVDGVLPRQGELVLYRIVQEALSNSIRHAGASCVHVRITRGSDTVTVAVEDDGRGFVMDEVMSGNGQGLGLYGMEERAAYLGGRVEIQSRPGVGTRVEAEIPIADRHPYAPKDQDPAR
jgi:two-component system, NarL family, sensor histidine kinase UhpB